MSEEIRNRPQFRPDPNLHETLGQGTPAQQEKAGPANGDPSLEEMIRRARAGYMPPTEGVQRTRGGVLRSVVRILSRPLELLRRR